jgi:uncharacterized protein
VELLHRQSRQAGEALSSPAAFSGVFQGDRLESPLHGLGWRLAMATEDRGFASMDRTRQREIASKGGRAAHKKGAAHQWTREEAQVAGRKGGLARHRKMSESSPASAESL